MKVIDTINKTELDLTVDEIIDLVANKNRQVDLIFAEKRTDADGYLSWDQATTIKAVVGIHDFDQGESKTLYQFHKRICGKGVVLRGNTKSLFCRFFINIF